MELSSETNKQIFLVISEENLIMIKTIKISLCTFFPDDEMGLGSIQRHSNSVHNILPGS